MLGFPAYLKEPSSQSGWLFKLSLTFNLSMLKINLVFKYQHFFTNLRERKILNKIKMFLGCYYQPHNILPTVLHDTKHSTFWTSLCNLSTHTLQSLWTFAHFLLFFFMQLSGNIFFWKGLTNLIFSGMVQGPLPWMCFIYRFSNSIIPATSGHDKNDGGNASTWPEVGIVAGGWGGGGGGEKNKDVEETQVVEEEEERG